MKFALNSEYGYVLDDSRPYAKYVTKVKGFTVDIRIADDPNKIPVYFNRPDLVETDWYGKGEKHRVENGKIARDLPMEFAMVEFETVEDILDFAKEIQCHIQLNYDYSNRYEDEYLRTLWILDYEWI